MKTPANAEQTIDFLLMDCWNDIFLPLMKLHAPKMRADAVVPADKIFTFKNALQPYAEHMQNHPNGFESVTLPLGHGMKCPVRCSS